MGMLIAEMLVDNWQEAAMACGPQCRLHIAGSGHGAGGLELWGASGIEHGKGVGL
jgi:hypothetical protein